MSNKIIIYGSLFLLCVFSVLAALQSNWKIIGISWVAFGAMALAIPLGIKAAKKNKLNRLVIGYGLASGAMITSAAIFLVPTAINHHPVYGGLGIAIGIMAGFAIHTLNHDLTHTSFSVNPVVLELTSHALSAGLIIGMVYAAMPELGILLGIAIISHKGPAGYAASRRLAIKGKNPMLILLPAAAIGLTALPMSLINIPGNAIVNALIFGFATGVFFHVAIDFLPECEVGGNIHQETELDDHEHHELDRYRRWAVLTTFVGGFIVFAAWYLAY
ncbi:ZIP family metal transporter [Fodinibius halophilus]|uniref:ZIP family metal transporter n=1 Tax=Fodinibius halophilus TaxID=1736908 RepID=A0A6M1T4H2_9BACT|nr:ZIP family metal transporter [Fodinibius halophilus]NGP88135.1 ZIP family metal transporter [Fodinibius halophilus]